MDLADTGRPEQQHVVAMGQEPQRRKFAHPAFIDTGLRREVELVERLAVRQMRELHSGLERPLPPRGLLFGHQRGQERGRPPVLAHRLLGVAIERVGGDTQAQMLVLLADGRCGGLGGVHSSASATA